MAVNNFYRQVLPAILLVLLAGVAVYIVRYRVSFIFNGQTLIPEKVSRQGDPL